MAKLIEEIEKMTEDEYSSNQEQDVFKLLSEHTDELRTLFSLVKSASNSGICTLAKALMDNKGESMQDITEELAKPKNVNFIRNLMSIYSLLSNIEPDVVRGFMLNLADAVDKSPGMKGQGSMGLMALRSNMKDPDVAVGFRVLFEVAKGFTRNRNNNE